MAPRYALEIMDRTLRDIMNNNLSFGGKIIILGNDFRQLLPIKIHDTRSEIVILSIKFSCAWKYFVSFSLTENIGDGVLNDSNDNIQFPDNCIAPINNNIAEEIYGGLI